MQEVCGGLNMIFRCFTAWRDTQQLFIYSTSTKLSWHLFWSLNYLPYMWLTSVLMTSTDVNDPAALSQSASLSYLSTAYRIQCISSLLRAVLTFRQAGPSQRELLAHTRRDNLVNSLLPLAVCFSCLSFTLVSVYLSVCFSAHLFSLVMHLSLPVSFFHIWGVFASLSPT